jgi:alpha-tubulin suppressor-like RCC1 family protein
MKKKLHLAAAAAVCMLAPCLALQAQISISTCGTPLTQNFDAAAAAVPTGWSFFEDPGNATFGTGTGTSSTGNTYFFGTSPEWAFGGLQTGSVTPTIGVCYTNNTGQTINSMSVSYTGETWRVGAANRSDRLDFQYLIGATAINASGTWLDADVLDYANPGQAATGNGSVQHSASISNTLSITLPPCASICFRWTDFNASGSDDGMGVDDFSMTPSCGSSINSTAVEITTTIPTPICSGTPFTVQVCNTDGAANVADALLATPSLAATTGTATITGPNGSPSCPCWTFEVTPTTGGTLTLEATASGKTSDSGNTNVLTAACNTTGSNTCPTEDVFVGGGDHGGYVIKAGGLGIVVWGENESCMKGVAPAGTDICTSAELSSSTLFGAGRCVSAVAGSGDHTMFLLDDGTVMSLGENSSGQIGNCSTTDTGCATPTAPDWSQSACTTPYIVEVGTSESGGNFGTTSSYAIDACGNLYVWGDNDIGQLGIGTTADATCPQLVTPTSSNFPALGAGVTPVQVEGGDGYTIVLMSDGTVYAAGDNTTGRLGDGTNIDRTTFVQVINDYTGLPLTGITFIDCGTNHTVALDGANALWGWGSNNDGQMGDGTTSDWNTGARKFQIASSDVIILEQNVNAGDKFTFLLQADGTAWGAGQTTYGQLPLGSCDAAASGGGDQAACSDPMPDITTLSHFFLGETFTNYFGGYDNNYLNGASGTNTCTSATACAGTYLWGHNNDCGIELDGIGVVSCTTPTNNAGSTPVCNTTSALSVDLFRFTVEIKDGASLLAWATSSEQENKGFEVEYSRNGRSFSKLGEVAGHGTTSERHDYAFTHDAPVNGKNYYRLKQVDFDGKYQYSATKVVTFRGARNFLNVVPTAAFDNVRIDLGNALAANAQLRVLDLTGRTLISGTYAKGQTSQQLDVSALPQGHYVVLVSDEASGTFLTQRFVKIRP